MGWNRDGWRLAREAFSATRRAAVVVGEAGVELNRENPDLGEKLRRAAGPRARALGAAANAIYNFGEELPTTEPEARRAIVACQNWKRLFVQLDSYIAEQSRLGRQGLTLADHGELQRRGWTDAHDLIVSVPWSDVATLMRVPQAGRPAPAATRDPTRRRRGGMGQALLPIAVLIVLMMSTKRR